MSFSPTMTYGSEMIGEKSVQYHAALKKLGDLWMLIKATPQGWVDIISDFVFNPDRFVDRVEEEKKFRRNLEEGFRRH